MDYFMGINRRTAMNKCKECWVNELSQLDRTGQELQKQIDYLQHLLLKNRKEANEIHNGMRGEYRSE
jgi:hypothetical protein